MMRGKSVRAVVLLACAGLAVLALAAATGSARTERQSAPFKVAWIYVGPHNDHGWSQAHDAGRLYVQKKLGSKVQTTYKENVALGPQLQQTVASLVRDGYKMIFGTSYGYFSKKLAAKYPQVLFEQATGIDLAKEKKSAESLVSAGADVLGQNVDSPATGQVAQSKGIPWVGYDSNAKKFAPTSWLTASVYNWGPYYLRRVKAAMNGTWKSTFYYGSIKDGFTTLAPYGPRVNKATKAAIAKKMQQIKTGKFYEFTGPLYDQKGKLRVPKGKRLTVKDLYKMDWLGEGVIGSPKG